MSGIKFGFKVKIVQSYERIFDKNFFTSLEQNEKEANDFWKEFFLLKANPIELEKAIKQANQESQQNGNHHESTTNQIDYLFEQCNLILEETGSSKLNQLNSILTIYVILMVNVKQCKKTKSSNLSGERIHRLHQNLMNLIDQYSNGDKSEDYEMIKLIFKLYLCICCCNEELNDNELIDLLICDRLFDQLIKIICNSKKQTISHQSLILITLIHNYKSSNKLQQRDNLFTVRLSLLEQEIALNAFGQVISKQLSDFNQEYRKHLINQAANQNGTMESIFSALTFGLVSSNNQQIKSELTQFETFLNTSDNRCTLLALFDMIELNRNFTPFLLTNHLNEGEDKETNNLFINFLEFTSINILCLREHFQKSEQLQKKLTTTLRICFIILSCSAEDQGYNSIMHDSTSKFKVQIHRSKMRHRNLTDLNCKASNSRPIAYHILDLMIEFFCSTLKKKHFQIDLYVFCNNIILKLLCYQIKFEIHKDFNWNELFQSLFVLLRYINANYEKAEELQIKRKSRMLLLANNVVNLFNLFIIFGDTFLYSPDQYDNLYYEILRNTD